MKNLKEAKLSNERKINLQKEKLLQLNDRFNFVAKQLGSPKLPRSPAKKHDLQASFEEDDTVPAKIYDELEKKLKKISSTLTAKESALKEKDEVLEVQFIVLRYSH